MIGKNNPFNIRKGSPWKGCTGSTKGFCDFKSRSYGIRAALYLLLRSYRNKGFDTIERIVYRYAPPSENITTAYIDYVSSATRIPRDYPLITKEQYFIVLVAMSKIEGNPVQLNEIVTTYFKFIKDFNYEKV